MQVSIVAETGRVFAQVKLSKIKQLPIRLLNFTAAADKDKTYYENKCAALDRQIDRLVYDLYGLTEEETAIVEGTQKQGA